VNYFGLHLFNYRPSTTWLVYIERA